MQISGKWVAADDEEYDDEEVSIRKRHSAFPIDFETSKRKFSERLLHPYYPTNNQNR